MKKVVRVVKLNNFNFVTSARSIDNLVTTSRYTLFNFLPKVALSHFSKLPNLLFLLAAASQLYEPLTVGVPLAFVLPAAVATILAVIKELVEDVGRTIRDKKVNDRYFKRLDPYTGQVSLVKSFKIQPGDVI